MDTHNLNAIVHNIYFALRPGPHWKVPPALERLLTERARQSLGASWWDDPLQRERLDASFERLSSAVSERSAPDYDEALLDAYLFGLVPFEFPKTAEVLCRLCRHLQFPDTVRILDVGCGPGTASLSAVYFFALLGNATSLFGPYRFRHKAQIVHLDRNSAALGLAGELAGQFLARSDSISVELEGSLNLEIGDDENPAETALSARPFDLVLVKDFFGEMRHLSIARRRDILLRMTGWLAPGGVLVAIEHSSFGRGQEFHQLVSKSLETGLYLLEPCRSIFGDPWGMKCYSCTGSVHRSLTRPRFLEYVCRASSRFDYETVDSGNTWCYAVLSRDASAAGQPVALPDKSGVTRLNELFDMELVPDRIDILAAVASQDPSDPSAYKLCDQSCGAENCVLHLPSGMLVDELQLGDVVSLKQVLVQREEDDEDGTVRFHFHLDEASSLNNLSAAQSAVDWTEAIEGAGYSA